MLSTSNFVVDKETKEFVADISDLPKPLDFNGVKGGVCFQMLSSKTGSVAEWEGCGVTTDPDGDILYWKFRPTEDTIWLLPKLEKWTAVIYND